MEKNTSFEKILVIACFMCNIAQIPFLYNNKMVEAIYLLCWVGLAVISIKNQGFSALRYLSLPIIFDIFCVGMYLITGAYITTQLFRAINLSSFIFFIGIGIGSNSDFETLRKVSFSFIVSSLIVALYLYLNIFRGVDWASSGAYLYGAKNSAGQIFLTAAILIVIFFLKERTLISVAAILFLISLVVMMKSRATLATLIIVCLYGLLFIIKNKGLKFLGLFVFFIIAFYIWKNPEMHYLYIDQIMLNNKDISNITAISSNRDLMLVYFKQNFGNYALLGTGGTYLESMPLAILMSYGLVGGIPILFYSLYPLHIGIKNIRYEPYRIFCVIIILLGLMMWFNGIFEEQSPFGPGVKCYLLWLITGMFLGYKQEYEINLYYDEE